MKVFILGIAGGTGSRVAALLATRRDEVSGLCRRPEQIVALRAVGAYAVLGDVATISEQELASAASGVDVLVFTAGAGEQDDDSMIDAVDTPRVTRRILEVTAGETPIATAVTALVS